MTDEPAFTVGDLKRQIAGYPDDAELQLDGGLTFYRFKWRGDNLVVLEVGEPQADLSPKFKKDTGIQVAFVRLPPSEDPIQVVSVPRL